MIAAELARARAGSAKWSEKAWAGIEAGALARLARDLAASAWNAADADALLHAYARLAIEGVARGYLHVNAEGFFNWVWKELLPASLPQAAKAAAGEALATCWNVCENLETGPAWLRRLFELKKDGLADALALPAFVGAVEEMLADTGLAPLAGDGDAAASLSLRAADRDAVAGAVRLIGTRLLAVDDAVKEQSYLVYLAPAPVLLGTARADPAGGAPPAAAARNAFFVAAAPELSQRVEVRWQHRP